MNIEQAKAIQLSVILGKLNLAPQFVKADRECYFSPLKPQVKPDFWVNLTTNKWFDERDKQWKDGVELVRAYLNSLNMSCNDIDVLRWFNNMLAFVKITPVCVDDYCFPNCDGKDKNLVLRESKDLNNTALIRYGERMGIREAILKRYLHEVYVHNIAEAILLFALAMKNESKGFNYCSPQFKGCVGKRDVSFIRGKPKPRGIHIFETLFDYLSVIEQRNGRPLDDDTVILHSMNCMDKGSAYIRNYGYSFCYTWMPNTEAGLAATDSWAKFCKSENGLVHIQMNESFQGFQTVHEHHLKTIMNAKGGLHG